VVGILESAAFEEDSLELLPGDRVVFYTDGISEAANAAGEQFGEQRLCEVVQGLDRDRSAHEIADGVLAALRGFLGDLDPQDDMTLLVVRVLEPSPVAEGRAPASESAAEVFAAADAGSAFAGVRREPAPAAPGADRAGSRSASSGPRAETASTSPFAVVWSRTAAP